MLTALDAALHDLLRDEDEDHRRVSRAASGDRSAGPAPLDPELAALAVELRRLRWFEPDAPVLSLLGDAVEEHAAAVERHLAWLAGTAEPVVLVLDQPAGPTDFFRLAS